MHQSDPTSMLRDAVSVPTGLNAQPPWVGQGTAWLVYDATRGCYHCYWLVGPADDHLIEHAEALNAAVAVEWARSRTPKARIRLPDHRTYWAGIDPAPGGFAGAWTAAGPTTAGPESTPPREDSPAPGPQPV